ncbi:MAG TPA: futalosine hydrolase [Vicinamibacterales bacterium]|jgi:futalosine hydrolase
MRVLVVAATALEIAPIVAALGSGTSAGDAITRYRRGDHEIDVLVTGIGMVATAVWTSRALVQKPYGAGLNLGLCGSFNRKLALGAAVHVVSDRISELGAEDGDAFLPLDALSLPESGLAGTGSRIVNASPLSNDVVATLPAVDGITVNTAHGHPTSIAAVVARFHPDIESMEGAAFLSACRAARLPCAQVRVVSNVIERRNRAAWKLEEAVAGLSVAGLRILDSL